MTVHSENSYVKKTTLKLNTPPSSPKKGSKMWSIVTRWKKDVERGTGLHKKGIVTKHIYK